MEGVVAVHGNSPVYNDLSAFVNPRGDLLTAAATENFDSECVF